MIIYKLIFTYTDLHSVNLRGTASFFTKSKIHKFENIGFKKKFYLIKKLSLIYSTLSLNFLETHQYLSVKFF
jgi:hypothetical protein